MVDKPLTTLLVPPSILECSDTGVHENLADRVLCFLKLQLLHVGLLIEKDPLQQGWFWRNPWGKRRMVSLVKQCFTYDTLLLLLPLLQIRCQLPVTRRKSFLLDWFEAHEHRQDPDRGENGRRIEHFIGENERLY